MFLPTKHIFEILRVPPDKKSFKTVYDIIKANNIKFNINFEDFYNYTHSCYVIQQNNNFVGFGFLTSIGKYPIRNYEMNIITFDDNDNYLKLFETIRTIIAAHRDGDIIIKDIENNESNKSLILALKNNRFKVYSVDNNKYSFKLLSSTCIYPNRYRNIDPTKKEEVIDKVIRCNCNDISHAQEQWLNDLKNSQSKIDYNSDCNGRQTLDEFLKDTDGIPKCCPYLKNE